jgi:pimeloyl-ACP methyl ester carboxylesterase
MISYPIEFEGITTRVLEAGVGNRNLLFIHGLGARADRWRQTLEHYATRGFHCHAFDLPGHGFATKGIGPDYSIAGFARLTTGLMNLLGLDYAALVGTSLGGHIGAQVCINQPTSIRGLALVGAVGIAPVSDESRQAIRDSITKTTREAIGAKLRFVLAKPELVTESWIQEEWRINTSAGAAASFEALGKYFYEHINRDAIVEQLAPLSRIIPMQLFWGELDRAVPIAVGLHAAQLLGGIPIHSIAGAGHAPYFETPAAFDAKVLSFLESLDWRSPPTSRA